MAVILTFCYETIMFGRVTHTLDASARRVRSLFTSFTFCNEYTLFHYLITCVSLIEKLATINLY